MKKRVAFKPPKGTDRDVLVIGGVLGVLVLGFLYVRGKNRKPPGSGTSSGGGSSGGDPSGGNRIPYSESAENGVLLNQEGAWPPAPSYLSAQDQDTWQKMMSVFQTDGAYEINYYPTTALLLGSLHAFNQSVWRIQKSPTVDVFGLQNMAMRYEAVYEYLKNRHYLTGTQQSWSNKLTFVAAQTG